MLRRALRGECALERGSRVLVAASGGADSTALLVAFASLAREFGLEVHAAHLHHRLRGRDADGDLAAVGALCARLGVPFTAARWNTRARMKRRGLSGQNGLRRLRREFLESVRRAQGCAAIATAHTADDQLETLLMRLARGAGLAGLAGIRPRAGRILRPLLMAPRAAIERDLVHAGIEWREDRGNASPAYLRNRIRAAVIPALIEATGVRAGAGRAAPGRARLALNAARAAAEIGGCKDLLEQRSRRALRRASRIQGRDIDLDSREMATCPSALQRTILRAAWEAVSGPGIGLTAQHLDSLTRLVRIGKSGARVSLPGGAEAIRSRTHVTIRAGAGTKTERPLRARGREGQTGAVDPAGR